MSSRGQPLAVIHHQPDEILAHPRFTTAGGALVGAVLDLYEDIA